MQLISCPPVKRFGAKQLTELRNYLDKAQADTSLEPISDINDILLSVDGKTRSHKNTMSMAALTQISQFAAPGLSKVITDVAGIVPNLDSGVVAPSLAIEVLNKIVTLREDRFTDKVMVVDLKDRRIDGIISMGYQYLSNKDLFEEVDQNLDTVAGLQFHEAWLSGGRTLTFSYKYDKPLVTSPDEYFAGYYFANNEISQGSIRLAQALLRPRTGERALEPLNRWRLMHSGRKFLPRIRKSLNDGLQKQWPIKRVVAGFKYLQKMAIGEDIESKALQALGGKDNTIDDKIDSLLIKLVRRGLGVQLAERILYSALNQGLNDNPATSRPSSVLKNQWTARTGYDLFVSLIRDAKQRPISTRETIERVAFSLLLGRIKL